MISQVTIVITENNLTVTNVSVEFGPKGQPVVDISEETRNLIRQAIDLPILTLGNDRKDKS